MLNDFKKTKQVQSLLFLSLPCFYVTTPRLNTQPPTSQLAKQICSCLSAQYESNTSSWLIRKKQTKSTKSTLSQCSASISNTVSSSECAEITLLIYVFYLPGNWNKFLLNLNLSKKYCFLYYINFHVTLNRLWPSVIQCIFNFYNTIHTTFVLLYIIMLFIIISWDQYVAFLRQASN